MFEISIVKALKSGKKAAVVLFLFLIIGSKSVS